jgi:hypothetical protein
MEGKVGPRVPQRRLRAARMLLAHSGPHDAAAAQPALPTRGALGEMPCRARIRLRLLATLPETRDTSARQTSKRRASQ